MAVEQVETSEMQPDVAEAIVEIREDVKATLLLGQVDGVEEETSGVPFESKRNRS
jgi:hypothetical protein